MTRVYVCTNNCNKCLQYVDNMEVLFCVLQELPEDAPVLILFPGLTGGSCDAYVQHAVLQARHAGIRAAVFNSRGTADSPVITPQFYSASFTGDTREVSGKKEQQETASVCRRPCSSGPVQFAAFVKTCKPHLI